MGRKDRDVAGSEATSVTKPRRTQPGAAESEGNDVPELRQRKQLRRYNPHRAWTVTREVMGRRRGEAGRHVGVGRKRRGRGQEGRVGGGRRWGGCEARATLGGRGESDTWGGRRRGGDEARAALGDGGEDGEGEGRRRRL